MSSERGAEAEPLSAVATIEKGTVTGRGVTAAGSPTPKFVQLVRENSGHFVTLSVTPPMPVSASYRQITGKLTRILR